MPTILNIFVMTTLSRRRDNVVHNKNIQYSTKIFIIQNGGHQQCEGYVKLKEKLS